MLKDNVRKLFEGDPRCGELAEALLAVCYERGKGLPMVSVLGVLDVVHDEILQTNKQT